MKNNGTALTYTGKVNIKVGRKTYSNYNSGYSDLFALFARLLCGYTIDTTELPAYIDVRITDPDTELLVSVLNQKLNITKQYKNIQGEDGQIPTAVITTAINDSHLTRTNYEDINNAKLCLLSNDNNKLLADIDINTSILSQISVGRQAFIEWSLYITNGNGGKI